MEFFKAFLIYLLDYFYNTVEYNLAAAITDPIFLAFWGYISWFLRPQQLH
jgi:hypothetical protein